MLTNPFDQKGYRWHFDKCGPKRADAIYCAKNITLLHFCKCKAPLYSTSIHLNSIGSVIVLSLLRW